MAASGPPAPVVNLLHVVGSADRAGAERWIEYAIRATPEIRHAVLALSDGPMVGAWRAAGAEVDVLPLRGKVRALLGLGALARAIRARAPDTVACHATKANLLGALAARRAGVPRILTVVHGGPRQYAYARCLPAGVYAAAERLAGAAADRVVAVCAATRAEVVEAGVPAGRVDVVEAGVPDPGPTAFERPAPPRALFLGRLSPEKGADLLAPIWAIVAAARTGARLVVAGDGSDPYADRVRNALDEVYDTDVRGSVGSADDLYRQASIVLVPSRAEGLPLVLLEAMSHGLAVVAASVGGIPEALGEAGVLVPPDDARAAAAAVIRLVEDAAWRGRLGAAARARYEERFTLEAFGARLRAALE